MILSSRLQSLASSDPPDSPTPRVDDLIRQRRKRIEEFEAKASPVVVRKGQVAKSEAAKSAVPALDIDAAQKTRAWADAVRAEQRAKYLEENSGAEEEDDDKWMEEWRAKKAQAQAAFEAKLREDEEEFARRKQGSVSSNVAQPRRQSINVAIVRLRTQPPTNRLDFCRRVEARS